MLPDGWEQKTIPISDPVKTRGQTGLCIEVHDLAASKLAAYREKDREFVRYNLNTGRGPGLLQPWPDGACDRDGECDRLTNLCGQRRHGQEAG
jgi:hypothetical protein